MTFFTTLAPPGTPQEWRQCTLGRFTTPPGRHEVVPDDRSPPPSRDRSLRVHYWLPPDGTMLHCNSDPRCTVNPDLGESKCRKFRHCTPLNQRSFYKHGRELRGRVFMLRTKGANELYGLRRAYSLPPGGTGETDGFHRIAGATECVDAC